MEIVRRIYREGLIDRDPKRLVDHFATPDIEYVNPPEAVDPVLSWRAEVRLALRRARQSSPSYRHELHELFDLGDTVVRLSAATLAVRAVARSRKRRTPGLRDGKVVRFERGRNLEAALEAAGLRE